MEVELKRGKGGQGRKIASGEVWDSILLGSGALKTRDAEIQ